MGCLVIALLCLVEYAIVAALVGLASMAFDFTFSLGTAFIVWVIYKLLKMLF